MRMRSPMKMRRLTLRRLTPRLRRLTPRRKRLTLKLKPQLPRRKRPNRTNNCIFNKHTNHNTKQSLFVPRDTSSSSKNLDHKERRTPSAVRSPSSRSSAAATTPRAWCNSATPTHHTTTPPRQSTRGRSADSLWEPAAAACTRRTGCPATSSAAGTTTRSASTTPHTPPPSPPATGTRPAYSPCPSCTAPVPSTDTR